ncbi:hypothetical protein LZF96_23625, partial [Streptomyces sp. ST2-7A]|nr:hypothetical protein [Streptomyces sp. ST2-7A]
HPPALLPGAPTASGNPAAGEPEPAGTPVAPPITVPTTAPTTAGNDIADGRPDEESGAARPNLPRRRRQEHLAPELREGPPRREADSGVAPDGGRGGHDPGLMAAFLRGVELAEQAQPPGATGNVKTADAADTDTASAPPTSPTGNNRGESVDHGE